MEKGFIKFFRKITEWKWYDDANTFRLFFHLLISANWEDKEWHKIIIKRGQLVTSQQHLADQLHLSRQQVRRALNNLISTNEITKSATSTYTIITVNNYDKYQSNNQVGNQRTTNEQPTNNQRTTTTKELKELKEVKERELGRPLTPKEELELELPFRDQNKPLSNEEMNILLGVSYEHRADN